MNRHQIVPLGIALAVGCAATTASAAYVTYRDVYVGPAPVEYVRVERVTAPEVITYDRYVVRSVPATSRVVERYVAPRETILVQADPIVVSGGPRYVSNNWDSRHPHWGHLIDHGLFNRKGPTDFGR
jgi:hypothetical protein